MRFKKIPKEYYFLIILVFITIFLRFFWLDQTFLGGDMLRDFTIGENITKGEFRLNGITAGVDSFTNEQSFGPLMYYIIAILILINKNPLLIVGFVALLNSVAVIITYYLCKKYFNKNVALFASFLYATTPWAVYTSSFFWNPNFLPFFSVIFIYLLFKLIIEHKNWMLIILSLLISLMLHFHLTPLFLIFVLIISILLFRRDIKIKYYLYSIIFFIIPFLPFIYFNLKNKISLLSPVLYGTVRESSSFISSFKESIGIPIMLATNYLGKYVYGNSFIFLNKIYYTFFMIITLIVVIIFILSLFYLVLKLRKIDLKNKEHKKYTLILLFFFIPIIIHFLRFSNISPHYYLFIYPIQFIILGLFFNKLFKSFKIFTIIIFLLIITSNIAYVYTLHNYVGENGATQKGEYSVPYNVELEVIDYIKENGGNINIGFLRSEKHFKYVFKINLENITYYSLENLTDLKNFNGYLILDRISYIRTELSEEESSYLSKFNKKVIKGLEVYEL